MFIRYFKNDCLNNNFNRDIYTKNDSYCVLNSNNNQEKCINILNEYFLKTYLSELENDQLKYDAIRSLHEYKVNRKVKTLIVILHGWGANSALYKNIASELAGDNVVIAPDFIGFGESGEFVTSFSVYDYAVHIIKLLCLFEYDDLILLGHSFGARVIFAILDVFLSYDTYFSLYNEKYGLSYETIKDRLLKLSKVVLTGPAGVSPRFNLIKEIKILRYKTLKKKCKNNPKLIKKLSKYGSNDYKNANNDNMKTTFIKAVNSHTFDNLSDLKLKILCEYFSIKFLIIHGKNDRETPLYMAKKMHKKLHGSKLYILKGAGHFAFLDKPQEFLKIIREWILC